MKKNLLLLCMLFPGSIFCMDSYYDRAARDVAQEDAAAREARIAAKAQALQQRDFENFANTLEAIGHGIVGFCRVVRHPSQIGQGWRNGDGEVMAGTAVVGTGVVVAIAAVIANLIGSTRSDDRR